MLFIAVSYYTSTRGVVLSVLPFEYSTMVAPGPDMCYIMPGIREFRRGIPEGSIQTYEKDLHYNEFRHSAYIPAMMNARASPIVPDFYKAYFFLTVFSCQCSSTVYSSTTLILAL